jgi:nucleoside 2-deoxyribosyltransferase
MSAKSIYLAGPITGCSHASTVRWRDQFSDYMKGSGVECLSPMRGKDHLALLDKIEGDYFDSVVSCARAIMTRDRFDCSRASIIVANLLREAMPKDAKPSLGTVMELAWADMRRIPILAIIDKSDSPYEHPMINEAIGFRVQSIREAAELSRVILCV